MGRLRLVSATLAILANQLSAQSLSRFCPSDVCYSLNIPESTASSGSGEIFFQISGPTSYSWIGLGQGSGMVGANIFVMYADGNGNVTVSPRLGVGHVEPEHDTAANIALLEGSGVANGRMVANVRCDNCESWQGGSMDFTASSGGWIFASLPGAPIDSTDLTADIEEHQAHGTFTWDFTSAQGGSDVNPFMTGGSGDPVSPAPTGSGDDGGNDVESESSGGGDLDVMTTAHGVLAAIAFLVLFPSGAIYIRVPFLSKFGGIWVHAALQIFAYCTFIAAAGLGIYLAVQEDLLLNHHPVIGMILLAVLFTQPFAGLAHHHLFQKKGRRTWISYQHIFVGRTAILLGMINGGLGLAITGVTNMGYLAAYGVVAGVMGSLYLAAIVFGEVQRTKKIRAADGESGSSKDDVRAGRDQNVNEAMTMDRIS